MLQGNRPHSPIFVVPPLAGSVSTMENPLARYQFHALEAYLSHPSTSRPPESCLVPASKVTSHRYHGIASQGESYIRWGVRAK